MVTFNFEFGIYEEDFLITRRAKGAPLSDPETERSYAVGDTLGESVVVCLKSSVDCPTGMQCNCDDMTAVPGTQYTYTGYFATGIPVYGESASVDFTL